MHARRTASTPTCGGWPSRRMPRAGGVGRALTHALIASADAAGVEMLTLDVRGDNAAALHLYRSLGFAEYGRLKDFVAVGSRRYDTVFYALDLREHRGTAPR